ncbi:phage minor head protein [Natrinema pallidum]|uniref:Head morphogenesis protein n=1 Tax=Natrinema pallidum TaxID=69527 RepID=A0A4P9TI03_9EURY|nr:phage minor head protein [Natrinema pallidum]QCW03562.1 head morphogenesis protein [Natrinema pallidum]
MCQAHHTAGRRLLTKDLPPEAERAVREFFGDYTDAIDPIRQDLVDAIEAGDVDPSSISSIRTEVRRIAGNYTDDVQVVMQAGTERGLEVGRQIAARRHQLDIAFDLVPERTLEEFSDWAETATSETLDTLTEDTARYIRAAHEEGLSIDELTERVNDELFDGRLQDWQARRTARTATVSSSNAGSHTAHEDADGVVAEEWVASLDGRQRDSHADADGQIVAVGNTFLVGGAEARHPGDPSLPLEELVNCRCVAVPVFRDELTDDEFAQLESGGRLNV